MRMSSRGLRERAQRQQLESRCMGFGRKKERGEIPHRSSPSTATPPSLSTTFIPDRILPKMLRTAWESVNLPASNGASSARRVRVSLVEVGRGTQSDEKPEGRQCKPEKLGVGRGEDSLAAVRIRAAVRHLTGGRRGARHPRSVYNSCKAFSAPSQDSLPGFPRQ